MRRRDQYFVQVAHDNAQKSCMIQKHGCVIVYNNKDIIAEGINQYECDMKEVDTIHAEVDAINKLRKIMNTKKDKTFVQKCKLYVVRIGSKSMDYPLKQSKPCEHCTKVILRVGIPFVYYSTQDEFLQAYEDIYKMKPPPEAYLNNTSTRYSGRPNCTVC